MLDRKKIGILLGILVIIAALGSWAYAYYFKRLASVWEMIGYLGTPLVLVYFGICSIQGKEIKFPDIFSK